MYRTRAPILALLLALSAGCGGGSNSPATPTPTPTPTPIPVGGTSGGSFKEPSTVVVAPGQAVSGINITVASPATAGEKPNIEAMGVAELTGTGSASNTGGQIQRGATKRVLMFGPGLGGGMTVTITGPNDISISNVRGITSSSGTPGIAFDASASGGAAVGARTVLVRAANNDLTAFTGGLEVIP